MSRPDSELVDPMDTTETVDDDTGQDERTEITDDDLPDELRGPMEGRDGESEEPGEPGEPPEEAGPPPVTRVHNKAKRDKAKVRAKGREGFAKPTVVRGAPVEKGLADSAADYNKRNRAGVHLKPLPTPPHRHYRDENAQKQFKPERFWDYWKLLATDPRYSERVVVYVYRIWPVMAAERRQVEKLYEYVPLEDVARRFGAGDYNLKLNDMNQKYATMCQATIKNVGARNLSEYPPVLNVENLVVTDPLNTTYIAWCRARGIQVPGDSGYDERQREKQRREDDKDMASEATVRLLGEELRETRQELVETLRERRDEDQQGANARQNQDPESVGTIRGMEVIAKASATGQDIISTAVKQAMELRANQGDPVLALTKAAAVLKDLQGSRDTSGSDATQKLLDRLLASNQATIDDLRAQIAAIHARQDNPALQQQAVAPLSLKAQLADMKDMKDTLRDILGVGEEEEGGKGGGKSWTDYIPQILQGITVLGTVIASALNNAAVARTGQGIPSGVPTPDQILTPEQAAGVAAGARGYAPGAVGQPPMYGQQQQYQQQTQQHNPQTQGDPMTPTQRFNAFLNMIQVPLMRSLQDGDSGADFAAKLIDLGDNGLFGPETTGEQVYGLVVSYPKVIVSGLIQNHPAFAPMIQANPSGWSQFMDSFYDAPAAWEKEEQEEAAQAAQPIRAKRTKGTPAPGAPDIPPAA